MKKLVYLVMAIAVLAVAVDVQATMISADLVAYYNFNNDDASNTTESDITGNGNTLTPVAGVFNTSTTSIEGGALLLSGASSGAAKADLDTMSRFKTANEWTITLWFRTTDENASDRRLFDVANRVDIMNRSSVGGAWSYVEDDSGTQGPYAGSYYFSPSHPYQIDTWGFYAITFDDNAISVYGNTIGAADLLSYSTTSGFINYTNPGSGLDIEIGYKTGGNGIIGQMDELAIWDRTLSEQEIEALWEAGKSGLTVPEAELPPIGTTILIQ